MKKILILNFLILFTIPSFSQIEADSIFIYKDFIASGSTARLKQIHKDLASGQGEKIKLDRVETADLQELFRGTKNRRYFQQKHGGEIMFTIVWFEGRKYNYVIELSDDYARMVNLDKMRKWSIKELKKVTDLRTLIQKNWP